MDYKQTNMEKLFPKNKQQRYRRPPSKSNDKKLYNRKVWKILRDRVLSTQPLCIACKLDNMITPTEEIDHIVPFKGDYNLFSDYNNLQGLCKSHHSHKTGLEQHNILMDYSYNCQKINDNQYIKIKDDLDVFDPERLQRYTEESSEIQ